MLLLSLPILLLLLQLVSISTAITDPKDAAAVQAFRKGLVDSTGRLDNWIGDPCDDGWEGVICQADARGMFHVYELRLLNHNLSGELAAELGNLENLQILNLMWNDMTGSIPSSLGNLGSLELLLLNGNKLTGTLPPELGKLSKMKRFQIDQNNIGGPIPTTFGGLVSVKHLHLSNNSLNGSIPAELGNLPALLHLLADNNNLSGFLPPELSNISSLVTLQLDNNPLINSTIPPEYLSMSKLVKLSLRNCNLQGGLPPTSFSIPLQYMDVSDNSLIGEFPNILPRNTTFFGGSSNQLSGSVSEKIFMLEGLQALSLRENKLGSVAAPIAAPPQRADQPILDLQNNSVSLVNHTAIEWAELWLFGNPACAGQEFNSACINHGVLTVDEPLDGHQSDCQPETCTPGVDELIPSLAADGECRCAVPVQVVYRLLSPAFIMFRTQYQALLQKYLALKLGIEANQVFFASAKWEEGPRLLLTLKIFPQATVERRFNVSETAKLYDKFSRFEIPDDPVFGPFELVSFDGGFDQPVQKKSSGLSSIARAIIGLVAVLTVIAVVLVILLIRKKKSVLRPRRTGLEAFNVAGVRFFTFNEMINATDSFSDAMLVGIGGYGKVYQGLLDDGTPVAIKRAKEDSLQGSNEFKTEIELLSRIHHLNLVSLVGYCCDQGEQMLVYEYMAGGTLRQRLSATSDYDVLDFGTRLQVALGSAKGILYLHTEANPPIIHRDIKASNILLDDKNLPKVADFGLSKLAPALSVDGTSTGHVSTVVKGTPGYLDPEYFLTHKLTDKSDVYSFGVVLMELITGMQAIHHGKNLVREVLLAYDGGTVLSIVDPNMGAYPSEALGPLTKLAVACCTDTIATRPSMSDVVRALESIMYNTPWSFGADNAGTKTLLSEAYDEPTTMCMNVQPR